MCLPWEHPTETESASSHYRFRGAVPARLATIKEQICGPHLHSSFVIYSRNNSCRCLICVYCRLRHSIMCFSVLLLNHTEVAICRSNLILDNRAGCVALANASATVGPAHCLAQSESEPGRIRQHINPKQLKTLARLPRPALLGDRRVCLTG
jgi:hypothetical protein